MTPPFYIYIGFRVLSDFFFSLGRKRRSGVFFGRHFSSVYKVVCIVGASKKKKKNTIGREVYYHFRQRQRQRLRPPIGGGKGGGGGA